MYVPNHIGRTPEEIITEKSYLDSVGYLFRAVSWLDYFRRVDHFPTLLYACIEGRCGIEYLLFEELVLSTGARLSRKDYERCVEERNNFAKLIKQLSPDYDKMQQFTLAVVAVEIRAPRLVRWSPSELLKTWGKLSRYTHWVGSKNETTEDPAWRAEALRQVASLLDPIWIKATSGQSGILYPADMKPKVRELWEDFKNGRVDFEGLKIRLDLIRPLVRDA